ncbi:MAG TPA: hypothetical protein VF572_03200 [Candidatus Saccharimonadales bacterium]|jgi:phytol kinase
MTLALTVIAVFALLVGFELWWRRRRAHGEFSRKFIHLVVGSFVAFWPWYLDWHWIVALSAAFVVVVSLSKQLGIFRAIHAVERPTWGELFFALAVGVLAFVTHDPYIYAAALLHMSLADGFAAVVGVAFGKRNQYTVFGHPKSIAGSATFFGISLLILAWYKAASGSTIGIGTILTLSAVTTAIENAGVKGLDNLLVPLLIGVVLINL